MAEPNLGIKIPRDSINYILLCLAGILIFILVGIVPAGIKMGRLVAKTADVKFRIEEQRALAPLYKSMQGRIEQKVSEVLPLPAKGKLELAMIDTLPAAFRTTAKMSGMSLVSAIPNLNELTGDDQFLSVSAVLQGDFVNLRKFLINLGGVPYVHHIEEISIRQKPDTKEFSLKIWVAVG
ncbi:MAG: hypothetical protein KKH97_07750 [Proteobacteria bacterium]|nr:hypothetical protein [Pseudomonadota bacterium]